MQSEYSITLQFSTPLGLQDTCHALGLESQQVFEIVEYGIVEPAGSSPEEWVFDLQMICTARRAMRLQRDLHMGWSAVALVLDLMTEREILRDENAKLQQTLHRFLID